MVNLSYIWYSHVCFKMFFPYLNVMVMHLNLGAHHVPVGWYG